MPLQAPPPAFPKKPKDKEEAYTVPVLPSGTPIVGFDSYPTIPQTPPSEPTKFPYGHALGPSIYSQNPTTIDLRTRMGGENAPYGFGQPSGFAGLNPAPSTRYIPFGGGGRTSISPEGVPVNVYPSRTDITGMNGGVSSTSLTSSRTPFVSAENPMLAANPQGFTPFTPRGERIAPLPSGLPLASSMPIEGGPMSLTGATAMTAPKTAEQQGRTAIKLPNGIAYVTPEQLANFNARDTAQVGRTPEQQQALLDNIRKNAPALNQQRANWLEQGIAEGRALSRARREAGAYNFGTDATGRPLRQFAEQQAKEDAKMLGAKTSPTTASTASPQQTIRGSSFGRRNTSTVSEGIMPPFDSGMSVFPSYMPSFPVIPNNAIASGVNQPAFGSNLIF